jgi:transketolase C-terminal domain/subunit
MRETFADTMVQLLDEDRSVALVLAEISAGYFEEAAVRHPDRVVNVGIREQAAPCQLAGKLVPWQTTGHGRPAHRNP